jgi:hypothetical protein
MEITASNNQSLFDIALQVYGDATGAFQLALDNDLSITADLTPGQTLKYDPVNVINRQVVEYYQINNIKPATALTEESSTPEDRGIFDETFDKTFE